MRPTAGQGRRSPESRHRKIPPRKAARLEGSPFPTAVAAVAVRYNILKPIPMSEQGPDNAPNTFVDDGR